MAEKNDKPSSSTGHPSPRSAGQAGFYLTSSSPPTFISFEDFMKASNSVANLALAHEIAIDDNFRLQKYEPENSKLSQLRETMMSAFWDILRNQLNSDPPKYDQALNLLTELRDELKGLLLQNQSTIRTQIDEQLDIDLIKQQLDKNVFELKSYANFIVTTMGRLCAPVRDEDIEKLKGIEDPVLLYKEIFRVLDLMKMDMANFTISQMRPYIQQQSVTYEKKKFKEFLETKEKVNLDGLALTKQWLHKAYQNSHTTEITANNGDSSATTQSITPSKLLCSAYLDLLDWAQESTFPECCIMDEARILLIGQALKQLTLVSTLIVITGTIYRNSSNPTQLKETLKTHCLALLAGTHDKKFPDKAENLAISIETDVKADAQKSQTSELLETKLNELRKSIIQGVLPENPVHKLLSRRLRDFILQSLLSNHREPIQIPPGLSVVQSELRPFIGQLMRIVAHNRNVFGEYYDNIIQDIIPIRGSTENNN